MRSNGTTDVEKPTRKPPSIAASSAAALIRHQNQRSTSTTPGPVPMAITRRNTVPMLVLSRAVSTPRATNSTEAS
jgi:hypothetical protein